MVEEARRIVIAGAGGFGREVLAWLKSSPRFLAGNGVERIVFVNDVPADVDLPEPIVSSIDLYVPAEDDLVICAIGDPAARRSTVQRLTGVGAVFATFVHDSVVIGDRVSMKEGVIVCPGVILTTDITIGSHTHININCSIGHDAIIDDFVTVSPACNLMGRVTVATDVFLGTAATLAPRVSIGVGTIIGAGSVVIKDVEGHVTAFGNPCRVVHRHSQ